MSSCGLLTGAAMDAVARRRMVVRKELNNMVRRRIRMVGVYAEASRRVEKRTFFC